MVFLVCVSCSVLRRKFCARIAYERRSPTRLTYDIPQWRAILLPGALVSSTRVVSWFLVVSWWIAFLAHGFAPQFDAMSIVH